MISKAYNILRQNPVLIFTYIAFMLVTAIIMYFFMFPQINTYDLTQILIEVFKLLLAYLLILILGLLFLAGFAHMTAQAVTEGSTSIGGFLTGIRRFIGRLLLTLLLMMAIVIGFSIIISMVAIPLTMVLTLGNADPQAAAANVAMIITPFIMFCVIAVIPFFILWFPALFIDNTGVIDSMKRGMKTGVKSYGILLLWSAILYLPSLIYTMINFQTLQAGFIMTPGYIVMLLISTILSLFYFVMTFALYNEKRVNTVISNT